MNNEMLRQKCRDYIHKHGTTQAHFRRKLGVSRSHFSCWLAGERDMAEFRLQLLQEILD